MKGKVIVREQAPTLCPNCDDSDFYYILSFAKGTKKSAIEGWTLDTKVQKAVKIEEHCNRCGLHNVR